MLKKVISVTLASLLVAGTCWAEGDKSCQHATYSSADGKLHIPYVEMKAPENGNQVYEAKMEQLPSQDSLHFVVTEAKEVENVPENGGSDIPFSIISEVPDSLMEVGVQQFVVIREKVFFDSFWFNSFWPEFPDSLEEREFAIPYKTPVIDFTQEMVIAVFLGFFPDDGFRIDVKRIVETDDSIIVTVRISIPDHNDPTVGLTDGHIHPHQIIKLKKSHKLVLFNTLIEVSPSWPPEK
jgi:hypothetical protein